MDTSYRHNTKVATPARLARPNRPRLYKDALWRSLVSRRPLTIVDSATGAVYSGVINGLHVEDGSGSSFIVTMQDGSQLYHRSCD